MRTNTAAARPTRTLTAIFEDAVTVLRQDLAEYGYIALRGGFAAAIAATILRYIDAAVADTLIVVAIAVLATGTLATSAAALERTQDGLQPDSGRSFAEALLRAPWLLLRVAPPALILGAAVYAMSAYHDELGSWPSLGLNIVLILAAVHLATPLAMYVAALFSRDATPASAGARTTAILGVSKAFVVAAQFIALGPAIVAALIALLAGFGVMTTALFAFVTVASMPLVAAMMSLIHAELAPWIATPQPVAPPRASSSKSSGVAARLDRHIR